MIVVVLVGVATSRPPKIDRISKVIVEASDETEASLIACQMVLVHSGVVMPVWSQVTDILEI